MIQCDKTQAKSKQIPDVRLNLDHPTMKTDENFFFFFFWEFGFVGKQMGTDEKIRGK